jgi:outer membrane biogenesis lipoprotein LolB
MLNTNFSLESKVTHQRGLLSIIALLMLFLGSISANAQPANAPTSDAAKKQWKSVEQVRPIPAELASKANERSAARLSSASQGKENSAKVAIIPLSRADIEMHFERTWLHAKQANPAKQPPQSAEVLTARRFPNATGLPMPSEAKEYVENAREKVRRASKVSDAAITQHPKLHADLVRRISNPSN